MDKRQHKRLKSRFLVRFNGKSGIINDYSPNGMQISSNSPPTHRTVELSFTLNGHPIFIRGIIHWIRKRYASQSAFQFGCSLVNPPAQYHTTFSGS